MKNIIKLIAGLSCICTIYINGLTQIKLDVEGRININQPVGIIDFKNRNLSNSFLASFRASPQRTTLLSVSDILFVTSPDGGSETTRLRIIESSGNIGIGTNVPMAKLHIIGSQEIMRLEAFSTNPLLTMYRGDTHYGTVGFNSTGKIFHIKNHNTGGNDQIVIEGGNGGKLWLYPDGKLYANNLGNIGDHKNMQWNQTTGEIGWDSSSKRYKTNIQALYDDWTKILKVHPAKYSRPKSPNHWEIGYIAEEMDSIGLFNLVGYDNQGKPDDVKYDRMVIYLTEMMKVMQSQLDQQAKEIEQLKKNSKKKRKRKLNLKK